jgi:hypothetical protein
MTTKPKKQRRNIYKDKRSYWLSHESFLFIQALARNQGISPSAFLEIVSRELAHERLGQEQYSQIIDEAKQIAKRRLDSA